MDVRIAAAAAAPVVIIPDARLVLIHGCSPDCAEPCPVCPHVDPLQVPVLALHALAHAGVEHDPAQVAADVTRVLADADTFRESVESYYSAAAVDPLADTVVLELPRVLEYVGGRPPAPTWPALVDQVTQPVPVPQLDDTGPLPAVPDSPAPLQPEPELRQRRRRWALVAAVALLAGVVAGLAGAPRYVVHVVVPPVVSSGLLPGLGHAGDMLDGGEDEAAGEPGDQVGGGQPAAPPSSPAPATPSSTPASPAPSSASSSAPTGLPLPGPVDPVPSEPAPSDPAPSDPVPSEPAPSDPAPSDPVPSDPVPSEPVPSEPVPSDVTAGEGVTPTPTAPALPGAD